MIAAFWGLGFIHLIGLALDPLMLVMPFLITARAVSHAIQMHDRYYEEFERNDWDKRQGDRRVVRASSSCRRFSGITTDAFGVLVILLVPVVMLRKLAITASWWILAITISEMLLNPIVYYYLTRARAGARDPARDSGWLPQADQSRHATATLSPTGQGRSTDGRLGRARPLIAATSCAA